ncbi:MAG TPA: hypothetical protein VKB31_05305 [Trueperaceae bacterium]|nr:hypothetical protein [Trueperaceae bacterium]
MTGTLRKTAVLLTAAILGAAFAAGSSTSTSTNTTQAPGTPQAGSSRTMPPQTGATGIVSQALKNTKVTLLAGAPGSGAKVVATEKASQLAGGGTRAVSNARYATLSVAGHSTTFAVANADTATGPIELAVSGVPGATAKGQATLSTVATYIYDAAQSNAPAVLLERGHGTSAVAFAVYDPAMPAPSLQVSGATQVMTLVNGHVTTYQVRASGGGRVENLVIASGAHKGQQLSAVIG